jgi:hypothetical protein
LNRASDGRWQARSADSSSLVVIHGAEGPGELQVIDGRSGGGCAYAWYRRRFKVDLRHASTASRARWRTARGWTPRRWMLSST